jgi:alpha-galactosidase
MRKTSHLSFLIAALICLGSSLLCPLSLQAAEQAKVAGYRIDATLRLVGQHDLVPFSTVDVKNTSYGETFQVSWKNTTGKPQEVESIQVVLDGKRIAPDTLVMAGPTRMSDVGLGIFPAKERKKNPHHWLTFDMTSSNYLLVRNAPDDYFMLATLSWKSFLPDLTLDENGGLIIKADGYKKLIQPGESFSFEKFVIMNGSCWSEMLHTLAKALADRPRARAPQPDATWVGWSCWSYYTRLVRHEDMLENIKELQQWKEIPSNYVAIDGGWWNPLGRGDYLKGNSNFPNGMKALFDDIRDAGFKPGIHLDAFRADTQSEVFKNHPEWFLKDENGKIIKAENQKQPYGQDLGYAWFDYTHPEVRQYFTKVFDQMCNDWGVKMIKADFLNNGIRYGQGPEYGSYEGHGYIKGITPLERFHIAMETIESAINDDVYIFGGETIFGPTFGYIDGARGAGDINARDYHWMVAQAGNLAANAYLYKLVLYFDADFVLLRGPDQQDETITPSAAMQSTLSIDQSRLWARFVAICGNSRINSDKISLLSEEKRKVFEEITKVPFMDRLVPLDLWDHYRRDGDTPNVFLTTDGKDSYIAVFNYGLGGIGNMRRVIEGWNESDRFVNFYTQEELQIKNGVLDVTLSPVRTILLKYKGELDYETLLRRLKMKTPTK